METSHNNVTGAEAAAKIKELTEHARTCVMITALDKRPMSARPMALQKPDEQGRLYFLSARGSEKNREIQQSSEMQISIANDADSEYMSLYGKAEVYRDQKQIDELYSKFADVWFDGKDDPEITIIRFTPESGHYWDTKHGKLVQMAGFLYGSIVGKQTDDGQQGDIKL